MQEKRDSIDDLAKLLLEHTPIQPSDSNWEKIQSELLDNNLDQVFKPLAEHQVAPAAHNWEHIQKKLPLHVVYKKQIFWLTQVAAILLLVFYLPQFLKQQRQQPLTQQSPKIELKKSPATFGEMVEQADQKENLTKTYSANKINKKEKVTEVDQLLASLLADEQEFPDSLLDISRLRNILKPIEPLPVLSATARIETLPISNFVVESKRVPTVELEISIPLIFAEEGEAKQLIKQYEKEH